jgi:hypothetical protein
MTSGSVEEALRRAIARVETEWNLKAEKEDLVDGTTAWYVTNLTCLNFEQR